MLTDSDSKVSEKTDNATTPIEGNTDLSRPQGRYDNVIRFIEIFPLRVVLVIAGMCITTNLRTHMAELRYLIPPQPFGVTFLILILGCATLWELGTGSLTGILKERLIKAVMKAEENASLL